MDCTIIHSIILRLCANYIDRIYGDRSQLSRRFAGTLELMSFGAATARVTRTVSSDAAVNRAIRQIIINIADNLCEIPWPRRIWVLISFNLKTQILFGRGITLEGSTHLQRINKAIGLMLMHCNNIIILYCAGEIYKSDSGGGKESS